VKVSGQLLEIMLKEREITNFLELKNRFKTLTQDKNRDKLTTNAHDNASQATKLTSKPKKKLKIKFFY